MQHTSIRAVHCMLTDGAEQIKAMLRSYNRGYVSPIKSDLY